MQVLVASSPTSVLVIVTLLTSLHSSQFPIRATRLAGSFLSSLVQDLYTRSIVVVRPH